MGGELWACPVHLRSATNVRRPEAGAEVAKVLWIVEVRIPATPMEPWVRVADWRVVDAPRVVRIRCVERQRWAAEDSFTCPKDCLGWAEVQVMDLAAVRTLVALAWGAPGFLYELSVTLEWAEVWLLAWVGG